MVRRTLHGHIVISDAGRISKLQSYHKAASQALHAFCIPTYFINGEDLDHWVVACRDNSKEGKRQWSQAVQKGAAIHDQTWRHRRQHHHSNITGNPPLYQHIVEQMIPEEPHPDFPPTALEILEAFIPNTPTPTNPSSVDTLSPIPLTMPDDNLTYSITDTQRCLNKRKRTLPRHHRTHTSVPGSASAHPPPLVDPEPQNHTIIVIPNVGDPALDPKPQSSPYHHPPIHYPPRPAKTGNDELGEEPRVSPMSDIPQEAAP